MLGLSVFTLVQDAFTKQSHPRLGVDCIYTPIFFVAAETPEGVSACISFNAQMYF